MVSLWFGSLFNNDNAALSPTCTTFCHFIPVEVSARMLFNHKRGDAGFPPSTWPY